VWWWVGVGKVGARWGSGKGVVWCVCEVKGCVCAGCVCSPCLLPCGSPEGCKRCEVPAYTWHVILRASGGGSGGKASAVVWGYNILAIDYVARKKRLYG